MERRTVAEEVLSPPYSLPWEPGCTSSAGETLQGCVFWRPLAFQVHGAGSCLGLGFEETSHSRKPSLQQ